MASTQLLAVYLSHAYRSLTKANRLCDLSFAAYESFRAQEERSQYDPLQ